MADPPALARIQFAVTTTFHFLFVLLTLGLVVLVAIMQTRYAITGKSEHRRATRFFGKLYVVNYALGIATGIVMEFQFGLTWSGLSTYAGDVFGAPLAIETLVAFFLESTFLGLWIFGWDRLNKWVHLALIWLTAATAFASAFWIMVSNAFLQNPVGYELRDGVLRLTDFGALLRNPTLTDAVLHLSSAALATGGFFVAGVSAWHFLRRTKDIVLFKRTIRLGLIASTVGMYGVISYGFEQYGVLKNVQPAKVADPDDLPALTDRLGADNMPPGWIHVPRDVMVNMGFTLALVSLVALLLTIGNLVVRLRFPLVVLLVVVPVPFAAAICGWLLREEGRQPWLINGVLRTADGMSPVGAGSVLASLIGFSALFVLLALADWILIARLAGRGPEPEQAPAPVREPAIVL
ncbi:cytochrome ubiquinol oxidase subunit I [Labedaea rhizosphaerae]|uniref:Cytochrome d ubiquinol oxidase subunit I n=1 Tax=Labedaea rhizosphaerae TaxID=598644 RepID=A0A4R6S4Y7_LABRH|nr:cytochrome ubiquinol oxidase subunit I [Labedaea rhizosphaerae]TDP93805.1 cytochrome d ubiquinol oxidase subunit I [Labedaea rhizosphaerae]